MGFPTVLKDLVRGLLMGAAEIVPGVSGGTVALIVGVYERLVAAISHATTSVICLLKGDIDGMLTALRAVDWRLLIPLGAGMVCVLLIGARFIPEILETYPVESRALFFGLIAGSLIIPWQRISRAGLRAILLAAAGAVVAYLIVGLPTAEIGQPGPVYLFFAAAIAICALILPGVSGAYFLLIFGIYQTSLEALRDFDVLYVAIFIAGATFGLGVFARLLTALLNHYYDVTMAVLVGLMLGSLRALWPWLGEDRSLALPQDGDPLVSVLLLVLAGASFVLILYLWSLRLSGPGQDETDRPTSSIEVSAKPDS